MFVYGANTKLAYNLTDSLRFRASASASLTRTATSAPTNGKKLTLSCWVKRGATGARVYLAQSGAGTGNDNYLGFWFNTNNTLQINMYSVTPRVTTQVFRDPSAWYHFVVAFDTTQASADNRAKLYVNGEQVTSFTTNGTIPADTLIALTKQSQAMYIGTASDEATYFDGYITEYNLIDGQQLAPSDFGKTDINGTWIPKKYTGSYGTNGFYLNFSDSSSVAALGTDFSGNSNTWTVNNVSLTAGSTYDLMSDVPTLLDEDTSNFATLNPNNMAVNTTMTDGNLKASNSVNHATMFPTNMPTTGKYYFECKMAVNAVLGLGFRTDTNKVESAYSDEANKYYFYLNNSNAYRIVETTNTALGANLNNTTSTFQVAIDFDAAKYYFGRDNTWYAADWGTDGNPASGANPSYDLTDGTKMFPFVYVAGGTWTVNFGQQPFNYTPPTGFKKINTFNLPDSTITDGSKYFDTKLYTGNGGTQSITGLEFSPDLVWIKSRSSANSNNLIDTVRGATKHLFSNTTDAEYTYTNGLTSFNTDGFSVGNLTDVNGSGLSLVGWNWNTEDTTAVTYTVKVVSDGGNKYRFNDFGTSAVTLNLHETGTYTFDQSDSSNSGHPFRFSTTSGGTHSGGSAYTTGVTVTGTPGSAGAKTVIVVAASAPTLYYYCTVHSGMGGQANTNATKGSSNFSGSTISTVSANPTAGFSVVTYAGNSASSATLGHGLGIAPKAVIVKGINYGAGWPTQIDGIYGLRLSETGANDTANGNVFFANTAPTTSVFTVGGSDETNDGYNYLAYCFAEVEGYSKISRYTGNGSTDGPFIYTGFRPAFVLVKDSTVANGWRLADNKRPSNFNVINESLSPSDSSASNVSNGDRIDFLSNGFKCRDGAGQYNDNNSVYVYMAFAENPFKNSNAR